jgi:hypothetical protein
MIHLSIKHHQTIFPMTNSLLRIVTEDKNTMVINISINPVLLLSEPLTTVAKIVLFELKYFIAPFLGTDIMHVVGLGKVT